MWMQKLFEHGPATDQSKFVKLIASLMSTEILSVQVEESDQTTQLRSLTGKFPML